MAQCILLETGMGTVVTRIQPIYLEWKIVVHLIQMLWCYQNALQMELCCGFMPFKIQGHSMQLILQLMQMTNQFCYSRLSTITLPNSIDQIAIISLHTTLPPMQ